MASLVSSDYGTVLFLALYLGVYSLYISCILQALDRRQAIFQGQLGIKEVRRGDLIGKENRESIWALV